MAGIDAEGIVALMANDFSAAERYDGRDTVGKAIGCHCLADELDVGARVVSEPSASVAILTGPIKDQLAILVDSRPHVIGEHMIPCIKMYPLRVAVNDTVLDSE